MAISPASYNIRPQRRADFPLAMVFKDGTGTPMNLNGWTVYAQVWQNDRAAKIADFTVTVTNAAGGAVTLLLPYSVTASLPDECRYDVMLVNPSGLREYYLEGIVRPSQGYTTPG